MTRPTRTWHLQLVEIMKWVYTTRLIAGCVSNLQLVEIMKWVYTRETQQRRELIYN